MERQANISVIYRVPFIFYLGNNSIGLCASYWVGRLPDEGDVQIKRMTGVLCNGLICQQVSSKRAYMQKTCDDAVRLFWPKKIAEKVRKSGHNVNCDKSA